MSNTACVGEDDPGSRCPHVPGHGAGRRQARPKGLLNRLYELVDIEVAQHRALHVVVRTRVKRRVDSTFPDHILTRLDDPGVGTNDTRPRQVSRAR
jgi:hypothetical protein